MSYTKGQLVNFAYGEIGIASYEFDIDADMMSSGLRKLDSLLATWSRKGITLSFPIQKEEDSASETDSGIPNWAWEAVINNLAISLAPSYGKTVPIELKVAAKDAYDNMCIVFAQPKEMQLPSMPKGAGYKSIDFPRFTPTPVNKYLETVDEEFDPSGEPAQ